MISVNFFVFRDFFTKNAFTIIAVNEVLVWICN